MNFDKFKEINDELSITLQESDLNYARLILPTRNSEVAVVGKYAPKFLGDCYITLNKQLDIVECDDFDEFYYGVSPKLNSSLIIDLISNLKLTNTKEFEDFIAGYSNLFMLHKGQEKYLLPLAKYITIAFAYNYGIKIDFKDESIIKTIVKEIKLDNLFLSQNDTILTIRGCPTVEVLDVLSKYRYAYDSDKNIIVANKEEGISIYDVYHDKDNISLVDVDVFYSGVLTRTLKLEEKESWHSNKNVTSIFMYYERSTYATVFALDNNFTKHPLMEKDREIILEFFYYDDLCKRNNLMKTIEDGANGRKKLMSEINAYLESSYNVNQIVVTGNIISSDNYLTYVKRSSKAIDSGKIYPSVNGNVEIADKNVEFYTDSVDVDYPSLNLNNEFNSFGLELCREAEAELNLNLNNNLLKCYGIIISGNIPNDETNEDDYPYRYRRLHFNILFNQKIDIDLKKIKQLQTIATEKYENSELYGVLIKPYKGTCDFIKFQLDSFLRKLMKSRLAITSVFTIALFLLSLDTINFSLKDMSTRVSFIFAVLVILMTIIDAIKNIKEKNKLKKYRQIINMTTKKDVNKQIEITINKILENKKYHPITYIALKLYLKDIVSKEK